MSVAISGSLGAANCQVRRIGDAAVRPARHSTGPAATPSGDPPQRFQHRRDVRLIGRAGRICAPIRRTGLTPATGRSTIGSLTNSAWASRGSRLTP